MTPCRYDSYIWGVANRLQKHIRKSQESAFWSQAPKKTRYRHEKSLPNLGSSLSITLIPPPPLKRHLPQNLPHPTFGYPAQIRRTNLGCKEKIVISDLGRDEVGPGYSVASLYPVPTTVWMTSGLAGSCSILRRRR